MLKRMRVREDVHAAGQRIPAGSDVRIIPAGPVALVVCKPDQPPPLIAVPAGALVPLKAFRVWLAHREVGLSDAVIRHGLDESEVRSHLARDLPACDVLDIVELTDLTAL